MKKKLFEQLKSDTDFRAAVLSSGMLLITLVFAVYNGVLGVLYSSLWHGSVCVYYLLLTLIRVFILLSEKRIIKQGDHKEQHRRNVFVISGVILLLLNLSMIIPAAFMVKFEKPVNLTLIPALAMAVYTMIMVAGDPGDEGLFLLSAITGGIIIFSTIAMEVFMFARELK